MLYIENGGTRVGIIPEAGGRIVYLSRNGAPNILKSDSSLWDGPHPKPGPEQLVFHNYWGQEVWIGPQNQWWKHQTLNEEKRKSNLFWPPDPYISYGRYTITHQLSCEVEMVGPESPICGLKLEKCVRINNQGVVEFTVKATNIRKEPLQWDLWTIMRTNGNNPTFVPVSSPFDVNVGEPTHPDEESNAPYIVADGYFSFTPEKRDVSFEACTGKAYVNPSRPFMATLSGRDLLVVHFEKHDRSSIHPEQSEVEIYNYGSSDNLALMEMEYHTALHTLQPGESMQTTQLWNVIPFSGVISREAIASALNGVCD